MIEVDFHLRRARFMDQGVDIDILRLAEVVDILENRIEFVHGIDAVGLPPRLRPPRTADRHFQRQIGVEILGDEIEFQLRRHHRTPAFPAVKIDDAPEQNTRRHPEGLPLGCVGIADHLRRRLLIPGHHAQGFDIGMKDDIRLGPVGDGGFDEIAGNGLQENTFRKAQPLLVQPLQKLLRRQDLTPGNAGQIRHHAFHLGNATGPEPFFETMHKSPVLSFFCLPGARSGGEGCEQRL